MLTKIQLPKAFSVRDEHEFYPMQHLMARLNPEPDGQAGGHGRARRGRRHGLLGHRLRRRLSAQPTAGRGCPAGCRL